MNLLLINVNITIWTGIDDDDDDYQHQQPRRQQLAPQTTARNRIMDNYETIIVHSFFSVKKFVYASENSRDSDRKIVAWCQKGKNVNSNELGGL